MTVAEYVDVDTLLDPISDDQPVGEDIREDISPNSIYYQIKDARTAARATERRIIMEDDRDAMGNVVSEWYQVLELAPLILKEKSKDLEIVAWYIEALIRVDGFASLHQGFRLAKELVERYWDNLYPLPDEDGIETRVAPITGLNGEEGEGTLIGPIHQVLLTQGYTDQAYAGWHYQQAKELEKITDPEKKQARIDSGSVSLSQIKRSALETPMSFYEALISDIDQCIETYDQMTNAFTEAAGKDAPPSSNIKNALQEIKTIISFLTKDMFSSEGSAEETEVAAVGSEQGAQAKASMSLSGDINSREDAVKALHKVSEFFRRTEPHSPVAYSLEQAIRWTRMSLPDLLTQLIPDNGAREEYFRLTGMRASSEESESSFSESSSPSSSSSSGDFF
ncbi:MAG: type VI secretion system protein TssA [Gammaproteobacteria bacterium]|nr:type VI secretion system protein TssA [Gammaproteobacteria bacterium]